MPRTRRLVRSLFVALVALVVAVTAVPTAQAAPHARGAHPSTISLPNGFRPEGITIRGRTAYLGSLADGDLYAVNLATGRGRVISEGPGTPSVGLKIDRRQRLFVAGGPSGGARVVSAVSGQVLASYTFATGPAFINDVVLARGTAWFTDSTNPVLYGLELGRGGRLPAAGKFLKLELGGNYRHQGGAFNLNGITGTPDGRALLAVQSATGTLYRIDPRTGHATVVDLAGATLANGDGMLLRGRTLYVVQNRLNRVAVIELNRTGSAGTVVDELTSPSFDVPTTIAATRKALYLPNARFSTPPTPQTPYTLVRIAHRR